MLTDLVCHKPTFIREGDLNTYNYFFGELNNYDKGCYFAPERFLVDFREDQQSNDLLMPQMDVFSAGCVIAEVLNDGVPIFDLETLREYQNNKYSP